MANQIARAYFSDKSMEDLEKSVGFVKFIYPKKTIAKYKMSIIEQETEIDGINVKINEKREQIRELSKLGFFDKFFRGKEIKDQKKKYEKKIKEYEGYISDIDKKIEEYNKKIAEIEKELAKLSEQLGHLGLTIDDLISEYLIIVEEIKKREAEASAQASNGVKSNQSQQNPQIRKFNERLRKYEEMKENKAKKEESESQPE